MSDSYKVKADLIPYAAEFDKAVCSWIDSEQTLFDLCRSKDYPPSEDIIGTWQREDISAYLLISENKPVAYGELWLRKMEREIEITHLLVDPFKRSRGLGTKMVGLLYERASQYPGIVKVVIHLHSDNEDALSCYLNAGFELVGTTMGLPGLRMIRIVNNQDSAI
ncbi:MAG: GNAT family N-acetyltransferase [bacterium]